MLVSLHVKNLALIRESEVMFSEGLNILSGETGAGKSIILGSVRLALGAKADRDLIRHGEDYALIELIFKSSKSRVTEMLKNLDLPIEEDGSVFIQRKIMEGRSIAKVNGETVTGKALKQIAGLLINIHGQNDTAQLLDSKNYLDILDDYAGIEAEELREKTAKAYEDYMGLKRELEQSRGQSMNRERELALAQFEISEIEGARITVGEDERLENEYRRMNNSKRIVEGLSRAYGALGDEGGVTDLLDHALREVRGVAVYDEELNDIDSSLSTAEDILSDAQRRMSDYMADMEFSQEEFNEIESRLDNLNHLKSKYGKSLEKVLEYLEEARSRAEKLGDLENYLAQLEVKVHKARKELIALCEELNELRTQKAAVLSGELVKNLKQLNLMDARCEVRVNKNEDDLSATGFDEVDFKVSFNVGEPLKSLGAVASGGELSRFMLALKTITADKDETDTLIFDEIDAGISGKTAWNVAEKMNVIGADHQVIAITHLPQIAAMSDTHFLIEKTSDADTTTTAIRRLKENESVEEIARLMSTDTITEAVLASAGELRAQALACKA